LRCLFEVLQTHLTEVTVPADSVVENLDVVEHIRPCLLPRLVDPPSYPLFLQTAEKRFRHGNGYVRDEDIAPEELFVIQDITGVVREGGSTGGSCTGRESSSLRMCRSTP
jgi:hypothetical protein